MKDWRTSRNEDARRVRWLREETDGPNRRLDGSLLIDFCCNDYLGFSQHSRLQEALVDASRRYGAGAGASPLITGYTQIHEELEEALANFLARDRALVFSSGYLTNLGCVTALAQRSDTILEDRQNHASLVDAISLCGATRLRYQHADAEHAAQLLTQQSACMILTDGVFSMDGDTAPIAALASLAQQHGALLLCDDAHGIGVLGTHGAGLLEEHALSQEDVPLLVGTLGKAFGAQGGFVAGPSDLIEHLLQYARSYIYDTALAPALAAAALQGVQLLEEDPAPLQQLRDNVAYFRKCAGEQNISLMESRSAIQPIILGATTRAMEASAYLRQCGLAVRAIRPPTVPTGSSRLRITLSAQHNHAQIDQLLQALSAFLLNFPE